MRTIVANSVCASDERIQQVMNNSRLNGSKCIRLKQPFGRDKYGITLLLPSLWRENWNH
ncbi:hypothetical protein HNQ82_002616 [Anoxybacillus tengchongensis]|uniref:Uncharacterized protein n=1 Tax=Anoxybacillus tengchongensis TaxID=576944 RepID=A0A7X0DC46_9BACL|nr:hypothetical protein [Anoxybacillus tengchongensis]